MFYRGLAAVAAAFVASAPAAATVYTVNATLNVPAGYEDQDFGGHALLDNPIASVSPGDVIDLTIHFDPALVRNALPGGRGIPLGYARTALDIVSEIASDVTFDIGGATGDIITSGVATPDPDPASFLRWIKIADPANFHGGSFTSLHVVYNIDQAYDRPITSASFDVAVPEPATWAMMLLGFGVVGLAVRRPVRRPRGTAA